MANDNGRDLKTEELAEVIREIQERVRSRYPGTSGGSFPVPLPDLTPILRARDAAEAKAGAIGTVNPRPPGLANNLIQFVKRNVARALRWHVRDQVVFNRAMLSCVETTLDALNEHNRTFHAMGHQISTQFDELRSGMADMRRLMNAIEAKSEALRGEAFELKDVRAHWAHWRLEWERKLSVTEAQFLRNSAELQGAYQHRLTLMEQNFWRLAKTQHRDFSLTLQESMVDVQKRLWADLEKIRQEYERLIHNELRVVRQKARPTSSGTAGAAVSSEAPVEPRFDYTRFSERFRGTEEYVKSNQALYVPYFEGRANVLDIGCGRGEFLETMRGAGVRAKGIDLSQESIAYCKQKGLDAEVADLFTYLDGLPNSSLNGIFCSQVVEHLKPDQTPRMIGLAASKLARGGILAIETPNPECLAIFATHFYLDPTHTRPLPPPLLAFYFEEYGLGRIEVKRLFPAVDSMPALKDVPEAFREQFFGGLDYAIFGTKL